MESLTLRVNMIAAIFGGAGLSLCLGSYLLRTHRSLTLAAAAGVLCWAAHFAAKGYWTPAVLSFLMSLRVAAGVYVIHFTSRTRWLATLTAWGLTGVGAWLTWQGWLSAPSTLATIFMAWAGLQLPYSKLRYALLVGEGLWFINGWATDSTLAMLGATGAVALNLYVIAQERTKEKASVQ
jgi:hypothetical protein